MRERKKDQPGSDKHVAVETCFRRVAEWVQSCGWIEVGDQDWQGFVARVLNEGGLVFEQQGCRTLGEALSALDKGLAKWLEENG